MKGFFVSNGDGIDRHFTLKIGNDTRLAAEHPVPANDTTIRDNLHIPILTGETIKMAGEVGGILDYYIWGVMEVKA